MKKSISIFVLLVTLGIMGTIHSQTITSVVNGDWTDSATWGGSIPIPGNNVVVNHTVTLDIDYGYSSGSILVNASGILNGDTTTRAITFSGGTLTVNGALNVAIVTSSSSGSITNSGTFTCNHLYNSSSVINSGTMTAFDVTSSSVFNNTSSGLFTINHDITHSVSSFTNHGSVNVGNDLNNSGLMHGSGNICVVNTTTNSGTLSDTLDFCDQTGGSIDNNSGIVDSTVTFCLYPCSIGLNENTSATLIKLYPNPGNGIFIVSFENNSKSIMEIYNMLGEKVFYADLIANNTKIDLSNQQKGNYFYLIKNENGIIHAGKFIIE